MIRVGRVADFEGGARRLVETGGGVEIGVLRHDGAFYAYENVCVHQGGPACEGRIVGRVVEVHDAAGNYRGQRFDDGRPHLVCPWHGFEYDLRTGEYVAARAGGVLKITGAPSLIPANVGNQDMSGRVLRYSARGMEEWEAEGEQRDLVLIRRAMEMLGIDYQIVFPTPMLNLGLHPQGELEVAIARAYARWMSERVLSADPRVKTMLYLPFNDPEACLGIVEDFGDLPGVVGYMVTAARFRPVHDNCYLPLYRAIEEQGRPLGFHAGYSWQGDRSFELLNRFLSVHALGFCFHNMVNLTNWVINGLPVRFPDLDVIWIESGLAWLPFLMQRLDHEFAMRTSEAPLLERMPSDYMRGMHYTSQPLEITDLAALETTFRMIDAPHRVLYSSDYPHWDFDVPARIYDLPFLAEEEKRAILGGNAMRLFGLP
ncbi:MAG TPA: amidohydrolase family protein [Solirubrobacteraceae bacterium]